MKMEDTRERLLLCAERLFAERGIAAVSMREVNKAAGQRNTSAIHYHFGSKDALIQAIFERRMREFNLSRVRLLDEVEAQGRERDLRAVLQAVIRPLAEGMAGPEGNLNYIIFFGQVLNESSGHILAAIRAPFSEGMQRARQLISACMEDVPSAIREERLALATEMNIHALAQRARRRKLNETEEHRLSDEAFVENLVDFTFGALRAPVSAEAIARSRIVRRKPVEKG